MSLAASFSAVDLTDMTLNSLRTRARGISLGLYAADLARLAEAGQKAVGWGCDILHFDVMDGVFVPAMTAGPGFVQALDCGALRDVHLMIDAPARHVQSHVDAGADIVTVHAESRDAGAALGLIRNATRPVLAGLALMPSTTLAQAEPLLALNPDIILVLSLDPRDGARPDIPAACARVRNLRARFGADAPLLAFDGGVTLDSIAEIAACTPDIIVSGSAVFKATDPAAAFRAMAATFAQMAPDGTP